MSRCSAHEGLAVFLDVDPLFQNGSLEEEGEGSEHQGQQGQGEGLGWKVGPGRGGKARVSGASCVGRAGVLGPVSSTHAAPSLPCAAGGGYQSFLPLPCPGGLG